jgi:hypothetical protein
MTLNWNEIKTRAVQFAADFSDAQSEREEAQTFWNHFFEIFGIERRRVAVFESKVKKLNDNTGFIDLLWPGVLLVEHKSLGEPLAMAQDQAENYFIKLKEGEHPRFILVCDFQNFWLKDLDLGFEHRFTLKELAQNISLFGFLRGQQITRIRPDDPINDRAVKKLSRLHNALLHDGFVGHPLQLLLVRLLFCMFADKTGLFEPAGQFTDLIENGTLEDGSNVGPVLNQLFCELDTKIEARQKALPGWFKNYPFVNGYLFQEKIRTACFDTVMRELLLDCCHTDWGRISPSIFGSMFQHIMDAASSIDHADMRRELVDLGVCDLALAGFLEIVADNGFQLLHGFARCELSGKDIVEVREDRLFEFLDGGGDDQLAVAEFSHGKIFGERERNVAALAGLHADGLSGKARQEILVVEADPESFPSGEIAGGFAEKLLSRLPFDGRFVVDYDEISEFGTAILDVDEVGETLAEVIKLRFEFLLGNFGGWHGHGDSLVLRELDIWGQSQHRRESERAIVLVGRVFGAAKVEHFERLLLNRLVEGFADELFEKFGMNVLGVALFDHGKWGLAGAEAGDAGLIGVGADDGISLAGDSFCGNFDPQVSDAFGELLNDNVHGR